jgi:hypothetical protein
MPGPAQAPSDHEYRGAVKTNVKDTTGRGDLSEFEIATALMRAGKRVLRPLSAGLRYDLAIDGGDGTVIRVQCKTGVLRNGVITFRVCNADARRPDGVPYKGQAVVTNSSTAKLRLQPAQNGQQRRVRLAETFEIR